MWFKKYIKIHIFELNTNYRIWTLNSVSKTRTYIQKKKWQVYIDSRLIRRKKKDHWSKSCLPEKYDQVGSNCRFKFVATISNFVNFKQTICYTCSDHTKRCPRDCDRHISIFHILVITLVVHWQKYSKVWRWLVQQ